MSEKAGAELLDASRPAMTEHFITLRPGLFGAIWGRDLIFLDALSGAYHMMGGAAHAGGVTGAGARLTCQDPNLLAALGSAQLLATGPYASIDLHAPPAYPTRSALSGPVRRTPEFGWAIARTYGEMGWLYSGRSLPFLIRRARAAGEAAVRTDGADLARVFDASTPWMPWQGACVFRSFMLMRLLSRSGLSGLQWVFGVKTWPFQAHCWVQQGDLVLSDYPENLHRFAPIFAA